MEETVLLRLLFYTGQWEADEQNRKGGGEVNCYLLGDNFITKQGVPNAKVPETEFWIRKDIPINITLKNSTGEGFQNHCKKGPSSGLWEHFIKDVCAGGTRKKKKRDNTQLSIIYETHNLEQINNYYISLGEA